MKECQYSPTVGDSPLRTLMDVKFGTDLQIFINQLLPTRNFLFIKVWGFLFLMVGVYSKQHYIKYKAGWSIPSAIKIEPFANDPATKTTIQR